MKRIVFLVFLVLISLTSNKLKGQTNWYNLNESNVVDFLNKKNPNGMISESYDTIREIKMYQTIKVDLLGSIENETTHEILFLKGLPIVLSYYTQIKEQKRECNFCFFNKYGYLNFKNGRNKFENENYLINNESEYKTKRMTGKVPGITFKDSGTLKKSKKEIIMTKSIVQYRIEYVMEQIKRGLLGGKINISEINFYDINSLIDIFISDLLLYSKKYFRDNFISENDTRNYFDFLENVQTESKRVIDFDLNKEGVLGISKSVYDDSTISISINPILWKISSNPKRLYVLYHELGHDVLNFKHGEGGKMMFTISDSDYSLNDFYTDKEYMFNSFINKKLKLGFKLKTLSFEDKFIEFRDGIYFVYYKNIPFDGRIVSYDEKKTTWGVMKYKSGNLVNAKSYDSSKEYLISDIEMKNKLPNGVMKTYYKSGKLKSIGNFINGTQQGEYIIYNEDGTIKQKF
jgi:hypothetical protein